MKKFILSILCVSVFFVGLGYLVEKVGARLKSDKKALALIKAARTAIGGDSSIAGVQSLRIKGTTTHTFRMDGTEKTEPGETTIAIQLPDKLSKTVKIGSGNENEGTKVFSVRMKKHGSTEDFVRDEQGNVIVHNEDFVHDEQGNVIVLNSDKKVADDGREMTTYQPGPEEIERFNAAIKQNEMFRLTLGLLLSPPAGVEVNYTYGGESDVDGTQCNVVGADMGGRGVKLFLNKSSNLPVMIEYEAQPAITLRFNKEVPAPADGSKDVIFFRQIPGPGSASFQVKFSDYRHVNGVLLPYHWTTTGGDTREEFDVTSYEVNPADIANSFENQKVMLRMKKEGQ